MSMQNLRCFIIAPLIVLSLLISTPLRAELVENLYQTELLVSDRLTHPDDISLRSGLKRILVKVSGTALASHIVDEFVSDPDLYMSEFHFESTYQVRTDVEGNDYLAQRLVLLFEQASIDKLLNSRKFFPLGKYRPRLLVWMLGYENKTLSSFRDGLQEYATQAGLPMTLLMANQMFIKQQAKGRLIDKINERSRSYPKALVVVVFLDKNKVMHWAVVDGASDDRLQWAFSKGGLAQQLVKAFGAWLDSSGIKIDGKRSLAKNSHQIIVTRVKNMADYAAVMEYVRSLPSIDLIKVASMDNQTLTLALQSQLNNAEVSRLLSLDRRMLFMRPLQAEAEVENSLRWSWFGARGR
ncbi:DUF2066 domain-containing protein [Neptunomonas japonica]|uniref:DUF2066 domain-containing protein n=1 Tax=Neptunomonas japonica TaxID=417574 RepID=UPI00041D4F93|nr:DUF2066 domain-containing protein [Neptunomonas japonica]